MADPKWKELLRRVAHILETSGGGYERQLPTPPDVLQPQRTIGPALRGNLPVSEHALAALPKKRVTKADKIIGAASDFTPVGGAEDARQGIHELLAGNKLAGSLALVSAALSVAPGGEGKAAKTLEKKALRAAEREGVHVFDHYSPRAGLTTLDPAFMGTGLPGAERARPGRPLMSHVYTAGATPEPQFRGLNKYRVEVKGDLYDLAKDPHGVLPKLQKKIESGRLSRAAGDELERMIQKTGAVGYANSDYPHIVKLFGQHPMQAADAKPAFELPKKYAIMTAENPGGKSASASRNAQYNRAFEKALNKAGIKFDKVGGAYTDETTGQALKENSYLLHDVDPAVAERLGRQFGQNAVVTHVGYHNLAENTLHPTRGVIDAPGDMYTELPDGRRILSDVNFGKKKPLLTSAPRVAGDSVAARIPETLTGVAMRDKKTGKVHSVDGFDGGHPAVWDAIRSTRPNASKATFDDGFVTSTGRYVDRAEAMQIARARHGWNGDGRSRIEATELSPAATDPSAKQPWESPEEYEYRRKTGLDSQASDSVAVAPAHWHEKHVAAPDAVSRYKDVAADIRAFPDQRRNDLIDALRGEPYMRPEPYTRAPAVITRDRWKPTSRGVFDRTRGSELYREPAPLEFTAKAKPKSTGLHPAAEQIANDPRVVERILSDVEKGRDIGGIGWYGLLPMRNSIEEIGGPFSFRDVNMAGAAGSARTPTHNELTNMSLNLFGRKRGLDTEGAREAFLQKFPGTMRPTYMNTHRQIFDRGVERGVMGPNNPADGALKIPHYFHNRQLAANGVPIDTHEQRMLSQATGISMDEIKKAMAAGGNNYEALTQPYLRVAEQLGMTPDQVQASRWLGGGLQTGLKSQPRGDFLQTLEDGLLFTARARGQDESPKALRNLWTRIVKGDDFFMPYSGDGGFPVY